MMKIKWFLPLIAILFVSIACTKNMIPSQSNGEISLPQNSTPVLQASNQFAFDFFKESLKNDVKDNNKLISPLSVYMALSMVYNGADNETKAGIEQALRLKNMDIATLNSVMHSLQTQLPSADGKVSLDIANSIWYRKNSYQPVQSFLNTIQKDYNGTVQPLDFESPASVKTINDWVSQKTREKIPKIIDNISRDDLMCLINAVYFNGKWKNQFKKAQTRNNIFYLADGSEKSVPFMNQEERTNWSKNNRFTIAELPYGNGEHFSMFVIDPNNKTGSLSEFAQSLSTDELSQAIAAMDSSKVRLIIPKWEYAYEIKNMKPELSAMGMGITFTDEADFSKMYRASDVKPEITQAIHKTYIKVDEEGTEAAAVTGIGVGVTSMPRIETIRLDHPFLYLIMEKKTNTILFIGMLNDPTEK